MTGAHLAVGVLATWRLTHFVVAEDGPWNLVAHLRRMAGTGFMGQLMDCFYCCSIWIALPTALWLGDDWLSRVVAWPALSGGAILLERVIPSRPESEH